MKVASDTWFMVVRQIRNLMRSRSGSSSCSSSR